MLFLLEFSHTRFHVQKCPFLAQNGQKSTVFSEAFEDTGFQVAKYETTDTFTLIKTYCNIFYDYFDPKFVLHTFLHETQLKPQTLSYRLAHSMYTITVCYSNSNCTHASIPGHPYLNTSIHTKLTILITCPRMKRSTEKGKKVFPLNLILHFFNHCQILCISPVQLSYQQRLNGQILNDSGNYELFREAHVEKK